MATEKKEYEIVTVNLEVRSNHPTQTTHEFVCRLMRYGINAICNDEPETYKAIKSWEFDS